MLQRACLFFLPMAALVGAAFILFHQQGIGNQAQTWQTEGDTMITLGQQRFASDLSSVLADLQFLADGPALQDFLAAGDETRRQTLERQFLAFSTHQGVYDKIRFIDTAGRERIRVDWQWGAPEIVPADYLRDESEHPYVRDALAMERGDIYISPFELSRENQTIEQPIKPLIRFAVQAFDQQGRKRGVIVLNYLGQRMLNRIRSISAHGTTRLWLLNDAGYWLSGPTPYDEWAFMYEDRAERSFARRFPAAWDRLRDGVPAGQLEVAGELLTFERISPGALVSSANDAAARASSSPTWILVARLPAAAQAAVLWPFKRNLSLASLVVLLLLGAASLAIARYWLGRQAAIRDLDRALRNLQSAQEEIVRSEKLSSLGGLVAGIAHELGTPIGNAVTVASTMSGQAKELGQLATATQIRRSVIADHVGKMVVAANLLLRSLEYAGELIGHFKQLAVDQTTTQRRSFVPSDLIRDVAATMQPQVKKTPYKLALVTDSQITLDSYPGALSQVLLNLLNNALIHGLAGRDSGTITIKLRGDEQRAIITVSDDGQGIAPENQKRIFDPFFTTRRNSGGTGLGLHIVHNIVTGILGGEVAVDSREGAGTTFTLSLPAQAPAASTSGSHDAYKTAA